MGIVAGSGMRDDRKGSRLVGRSGLFVTVTAPGDREHRLPSGRVCPCTDSLGVDLATWNASTGAKFNRLMQDLRRTFGADIEYVKAAETQKRGALHFHMILRRRGGLPIDMHVPTFRALAMKHGFGHSVDVQQFTPARAAYIAKYAAKSSNERVDVPWDGMRRVTKERANRVTGELVTVVAMVQTYSPTYKTWTASRQWGESMKMVRASQGHYLDLMRALPSWHESSAGAQLQGHTDLVPVRPDRPGDSPGDQPD